jgi:hypothetical protein
MKGRVKSKTPNKVKESQRALQSLHTFLNFFTLVEVRPHIVKDPAGLTLFNDLFRNIPTFRYFLDHSEPLIIPLAD